MKKKKWTMPEWMEPFRKFLTEPDGAEEYKNCDGVNCNVVVNAPRALLCQTVSSEIGLLYRLHEEGQKRMGVSALLETMKLISLGIDHRKPGGMSTDPVQVPRPVLRQMAAEAVAKYEKEAI
jgi:hypothetical protein